MFAMALFSIDIVVHHVLSFVHVPIKHQMLTCQMKFFVIYFHFRVHSNRYACIGAFPPPQPAKYKEKNGQIYITYLCNCVVQNESGDRETLTRFCFLNHLWVYTFRDARRDCDLVILRYVSIWAEIHVTFIRNIFHDSILYEGSWTPTAILSNSIATWVACTY